MEENRGERETREQGGGEGGGRGPTDKPHDIARTAGQTLWHHLISALLHQVLASDRMPDHDMLAGQFTGEGKDY